MLGVIADAVMQAALGIPPAGPNGRGLGGLVTTVTDYIAVLLQALLKAVYYIILGWMLLATASVMYAGLYHLLMPAKLHDKPLYFDYGMRGIRAQSKPPEANVDFLAQHTQWKASELIATRQVAERVLLPGQQYVVGVEFTLPQTPTNKEVGVFMVHVTLLDTHNHTLGTSARAAFLPHTSPLLNKVQMFFKWPLYLAGVCKELSVVHVPCFDHFEESDEHPLSAAQVVLTSRDVQIAGALLYVSPQLKGLQWLMFHWFYTTSALGVLFIASLMLTFFGFLYVFYNVIQMSPEDGGNGHKAGEAAGRDAGAFGGGMGGMSSGQAAATAAAQRRGEERARGMAAGGSNGQRSGSMVHSRSDDDFPGQGGVHTRDDHIDTQRRPVSSAQGWVGAVVGRDIAAMDRTPSEPLYTSAEPIHSSSADSSVRRRHNTVPNDQHRNRDNSLGNGGAWVEDLDS